MAFQSPKPVLFDHVVEDTTLISPSDVAQDTSTYQEYDNVYFAFIWRIKTGNQSEKCGFPTT